MEEKMSKIFRFNENNVCCNPDVIRINDYVTIEIAKLGFTWISGHHYYFTMTSSGKPCAPWKLFRTRDEAVKYEIKGLIENLEHSIKDHKDSEFFGNTINKMKKSVKDLKQYLFDITHVQLSLF